MRWAAFEPDGVRRDAAENSFGHPSNGFTNISASSTEVSGIPPPDHRDRVMVGMPRLAGAAVACARLLQSFRHLL